MQRSVKRRRKRRGARLWKMIEWALVAVLILSAWIGVRKHFSTRAVEAEEEGAALAVQRLASASPEATDRMTSATPKIDAAFQPLIAENPDIAGLLEIDGASMYVCQTDNNTFYMDHQFDRQENPAGTIFMDCRCALYPLGENTLLYGHNMRDGSRFGKLRKYQDDGYCAENRRIRFSTPYERGDYELFSVILTTTNADQADYFDYSRFDFADEDDFANFVAEAKRRSLFDFRTEVAYGDRLLTLVTCFSGMEDGRLIVICKRVDSDAPTNTKSNNSHIF